jgi:hypothetical protein
MRRRAARVQAGAKPLAAARLCSPRRVLNTRHCRAPPATTMPAKADAGVSARQPRARARARTNSARPMRGSRRAAPHTAAVC